MLGKWPCTVLLSPEGLKSLPGHQSLWITGVCFLKNFSGEFIVHPVPPCKGSSSISMSYGFVFSVSDFVLPLLLFLCQHNSAKCFQCSSVIRRCRYLCSLPHFCERFGQYPDSHTLPWFISSLWHAVIKPALQSMAVVFRLYFSPLLKEIAHPPTTKKNHNLLTLMLFQMCYTAFCFCLKGNNRQCFKERLGCTCTYIYV